MNKYKLGAMVAAGLLAGGMSAGSASAADLGGNCCADLEERIAELEATTVRKGNRKVSLTISGFVAQQVMYWDDGFEENVYISDTGSVSIGTHVRFAGQATIAPGWTAGYVLKLETIQNDSLLQDQDNDNGAFANAMALLANGNTPSRSAVAVESSYWFVKSESLGKLSVGKQSSAADNQAIIVDGSGSLVQANYVMYDVNFFNIRIAGTGATFDKWGSLATCAPLNGAAVGVGGDCDGFPNNQVRYDTPVFAGFSASASWGEDDVWSVSARYAGEFSGFKLAAAVAYVESTDENGPGAIVNGPNFEASAWQAGAYVQHVPTGLFLYGAYAEDENDTPGVASLKPDGSMWYIKAGLRQRWSSLGHTVLYGEYSEKEDQMQTALFAAGVAGSELEQYGLGVVQEIDAAAMSVWLAWRHYEVDATCAAATACSAAFGAGPSLEDMDIVKAGALISF